MTRNAPKDHNTPGNRLRIDETLSALRVLVRVGLPLLFLFLCLIMFFTVVLPKHLPSGWFFEAPAVLLVMNTLFSAMVFAVAAVALWSLFAGGSADLLFLGCCTLALGAASFIGGLLGAQAVANVNLTVHNTGVLLAAAFQFAGVLGLFLRVSGGNRAIRRANLALFAYVAIIVFMLALTFAALHGYTPPFTVPGSGNTLLREATLGATTFLFGVSSILLVLFNRERSFFVSCYSVALGLITISVVSLVLSRQANSPLSWLGRSAQFTSGIYFVAAVVTTVRTAWANRWTVPDALTELLRPSEALYRDLAETASDAIILMNIGGYILLWNEAAEWMFGYNRTEAVRLGPSDLMDAESANMLAGESVIAAAKGPGSKTREVKARRKGGDEFPAEVSFSSRRLRGSLFTTLVIRDITERKRMEEELRKSRDELELLVEERTAMLSEAYDSLQAEVEERKQAEEHLRQAHKLEAIGTLAGGIAHDFNNMLAVIIGNAELALDEFHGNDGPFRNLDEIVKASKRARDLVRQILTFSRKSEQQQKNQALTPLLEESFNLLRASIPTFIEMKLAVNTKADMARVNEAQFQQILVNLCNNAAHAMREKGGLLEVSLEDETLHLDGSDPTPRQCLKLTVRDTGIGMDEGVKKRIFDPFFTTKGPGEGTGMGLAVVYGIVEAHNGLITVHSEPGKGSSFSVFLPKTNGTAPETGATEVAITGGEERIMFIDDENSIAHMASAMLERLGYEVASFTDPETALDAFTRSPQNFDLVITDQTMPKMTGAMLAEKLKAVRPDIPVMLCTGYSHIVSSEDAKSRGIEGYVMKPLSKVELAEAVRKVLDQRGAFTDFSSC